MPSHQNKTALFYVPDDFRQFHGCEMGVSLLLPMECCATERHRVSMRLTPRIPHWHKQEGRGRRCLSLYGFLEASEICFLNMACVPKEAEEDLLGVPQHRGGNKTQQIGWYTNIRGIQRAKADTGTFSWGETVTPFSNWLDNKIPARGRTEWFPTSITSVTAAEGF